MNKKIITTCFLGTAALALCLFAGCAGQNASVASPSPSPEVSAPAVSVSPSPTPSEDIYTKDYISGKLKALGENVYDVTWSPDNKSVTFIKQDTDAANVYVWKIGAEDAALVIKASDTTDGFLWSPDSKYFLINVGHMGPGTITSTLIDAESLSAVSDVLTTVSISPPVWSADSKFIALSTDDQATNAIGISVYSVLGKTTVNVLKSTNPYGPYVVEYWKVDGSIGYTEITNSNGDRTEKTVNVGE